jgi:uncharacterized protein
VTARLEALHASARLVAPLPFGAADELLDGAPARRGRVLMESVDGRVSAGVWECDACRVETVVEGDELLVVIEGRLVIQTGQGQTLELGRGDVALLPDGLCCVLTVPERCRCAFHAVP